MIDFKMSLATATWCNIEMRRLEKVALEGSIVYLRPEDKDTLRCIIKLACRANDALLHTRGKSLLYLLDEKRGQQVEKEKT